MIRLILIWLALGLVTSALANGNETQTANNLKQIGLAIAQWSSDYSDHLPDMRSWKNFKQALRNLVGSDFLFADPQTGEPFHLNPVMAGHNWQEDADSVLVFTRAREDGSRMVLFNDGHVQVVLKGAWEAMRREKKVVDESGDIVELKLQNLAMLGKALTEYVQDGDKTLPPLNDLAATKSALLPYTQMQDVFVQPGTKVAYAVNTSLAHRRFADIKSPEQLVVFYEAAPMTNDTRGVLYLNGKVERIPEAKWPELREISGIR